MRSLKTEIVKLFATGFYSGYARSAPGTCGTLAAVLLVWITNRLSPALFSPWPSTSSIWLSLLITFFAVGISSAALRLQIFGADRKDPQQVVIDEFAGFLIAITGHPLTPFTLFAGFILFRIFDITKPPPAKAVEKLPSGLGIVLDDVVAGVYANISLCLVRAILR